MRSVEMCARAVQDGTAGLREAKILLQAYQSAILALDEAQEALKEHCKEAGREE